MTKQEIIEAVRASLAKENPEVDQYFESEIENALNSVLPDEVTPGWTWEKLEKRIIEIRATSDKPGWRRWYLRGSVKTAYQEALADSPVPVLRKELEEAKAKQESEYKRGLEEGHSCQAILEIQGRERFVSDLKTEIGDENENLKAEIADLRKKLAQSQSDLSDESNIVAAQKDALRAQIAMIEDLRKQLVETNCDWSKTENKHKKHIEQLTKQLGDRDLIDKTNDCIEQCKPKDCCHIGVDKGSEEGSFTVLTFTDTNDNLVGEISIPNPQSPAPATELSAELTDEEIDYDEVRKVFDKNNRRDDVPLNTAVWRTVNHFIDRCRPKLCGPSAMDIYNLALVCQSHHSQPAYGAEEFQQRYERSYQIRPIAEVEKPLREENERLRQELSNKEHKIAELLMEGASLVSNLKCQLAAKPVPCMTEEEMRDAVVQKIESLNCSLTAAHIRQDKPATEWEKGMCCCIMYLSGHVADQSAENAKLIETVVRRDSTIAQYAAELDKMGKETEQLRERIRAVIDGVSSEPSLSPTLRVNDEWPKWLQKGCVIYFCKSADSHPDHYDYLKGSRFGKSLGYKTGRELLDKGGVALPSEPEACRKYRMEHGPRYWEGRDNETLWMWNGSETLCASKYDPQYTSCQSTLESLTNDFFVTEISPHKGEALIAEWREATENKESQ